MTFSSSTYTFVALIIRQCPGLSVNRIEDLRRDLHPKPSPMVCSPRSRHRKKLSNTQGYANLNDIPIYRPEPQRKRRPSFLIEKIK